MKVIYVHQIRCDRWRGNGSAILSRLLDRGVYQSSEIIVSDPTLQQRELLQREYGVQVTADNNLAATAPVLLLAIKPQIFDRVIADLVRPLPAQLVISILAGVSLDRLERAFPDRAIVRAMPNTPATVGAAMTAIAAGARVGEGDLALATQIFKRSAKSSPCQNL